MVALLLTGTVVVAGVGCGGSGDDSADQSAEIASLKTQVANLESSNRALRQRNARLRRQLREAGKAANRPSPAPEPGPTLSYGSFQTPSGNIACNLEGAVARCDIKEKSWNPGPRPSDCPVDWGGGLQVGGSGKGEVVCAGDTVMNPDAPILQYGEQTQVGDFLCASEEDGVSCVQTASNHGFRISRQSEDRF